jgi:hypothetical protein
VVPDGPGVVHSSGGLPGAVEQRLELLRIALVVALEEMAVAIEGDRDGGVAEVLGERLGVDARGDHQRGEGVAALDGVDRELVALDGPVADAPQRVERVQDRALAMAVERAEARPAPVKLVGCL